MSSNVRSAESNLHGGILLAAGVLVAAFVIVTLTALRVPPGSAVLTPLITVIHPFLRLPAPHNAAVVILSVMFNGFYYLCAGWVFALTRRKPWSALHALFVGGVLVASLNLALTVVFLICEHFMTGALTTSEVFGLLPIAGS